MKSLQEVVSELLGDGWSRTIIGTLFGISRDVLEDTLVAVARVKAIGSPFVVPKGEDIESQASKGIDILDAIAVRCLLEVSEVFDEDGGVELGGKYIGVIRTRLLNAQRLGLDSSDHTHLYSARLDDPDSLACLRETYVCTRIICSESYSSRMLSNGVQLNKVKDECKVEDGEKEHAFELLAQKLIEFLSPYNFTRVSSVPLGTNRVCALKNQFVKVTLCSEVYLLIELEELQVPNGSRLTINSAPGSLVDQEDKMYLLKVPSSLHEMTKVLEVLNKYLVKYFEQCLIGELSVKEVGDSLGWLMVIDGILYNLPASDSS